VRAAAGRRGDRPVLCVHVDGHRSLAHGHGHLPRTRVRALRDGGRVALVRHLRPTVVLDLYLSFVRAGPTLDPTANSWNNTQVTGSHLLSATMALERQVNCSSS
jgi:hypothetical protein